MSHAPSAAQSTTASPEPALAKTAPAECPVCRATGAVPFTSPETWRFVQCPSCSFVFTDPPPDQGDLNALYTGNAGISDTTFPKARSRKRRALLLALRLRKYLKGGRKAIDIGCSGGFVTDAFRRMGAEAYGFDINSAAIGYAKATFPKCRFVDASYDTIADLPDDFDFVYSSEVIEHVAKLDSYMDLLDRLTRPGGFVYITTPDIGSPNLPADIRDWGQFSPPEHIQFFNRQSLSTLFERHGFSFVRQRPDSKTGLKVLFRKQPRTGG